MISQLDFMFPFFVFGYGLLMTVILNHQGLMEIAEQQLPTNILTQFRAHRALGITCLIVGTFWSLQNLWVS